MRFILALIAAATVSSVFAMPADVIKAPKCPAVCSTDKDCNYCGRPTCNAGICTCTGIECQKHELLVGGLERSL
ncbi:hypothetical protein BDR03DRAFT_952332 [Suillus americanus]|nr:hypothetical protein BDR03DRAFT_952332 [Suillus americanus]